MSAKDYPASDKANTVDWYKQQPNYQLRFKNFPVGFFYFDGIPTFYCHTVRPEQEDCTTYVHHCHTLFFSKKKGLFNVSFKVDSVLSEQQIQEKIIGTLTVEDSGGSSVIELNWLYKSKEFNDFARMYCDLLDTGLTVQKNMNSYHERVLYSKDEIKFNARFKYAKSLTLTKVMYLNFRKLINELPERILYLMRRHNDFSVNCFNFLYAGGSATKQMRRQDAMQAHSWYLTKGGNDYTNKKWLRHVDAGKSIDSYIKEQEGVSHGVTKFLHGLSYNHWRNSQARRRVIPNFLKSIQIGLAIFDGIKASQKSICFFETVTEQALTMQRFLDGINLGELYTISMRTNPLAKNNPLSFLSKEFAHCWQQKKSIDALQELLESIRIQDVSDYINHLQGVGIAINEPITAKQLINYSKRWHKHVIAIQQLREDIFVEEGVVDEETLCRTWSPVIVHSALTDDLNVVELTTKQELVDEGRRQEHCVGDYSFFCAFHNIHIFSVRNKDGESQSTFEVAYRNQKDGKTVLPYLVQHRAFKNAKPSKVIADAVVLWLDQNKDLFLAKYDELDRECADRKALNERCYSEDQELRRKANAIFSERVISMCPKCYPKTKN
jgi:hypothetical protein